MDPEIDLLAVEPPPTEEQVSLLKKRYPGAFSSTEPTPFEKSGSKVEQHYFHNERAPYYLIQREQPQHLVVVYLKAQGMKNVDIAKELGISAVSVSNICRQEWARKRISEAIHENGGNEVKELLSESEAAKCLRALAEIRDNEEAANADKIKASVAHLDRIYGRPNQPVTSHKGIDLDSMSDEELARIANGTSSHITNSTGSSR